MENRTEIDWVSFRTRTPMAALGDSVCSLFGLEPLPFPTTGLKHSGRGQRGFDDLYDVLHLGKKVATIATGGESMRGWSMVTIPATGLAHIAGDSAATLSQLVEDHSAQYKRVDIALTTDDGSISYETVHEAYKSGRFTTYRRPPRSHSIIPENPRDGRTIYIGDRTQPLCFRGYEKGFEILQRWPRSTENVTHIDGARVEDIFRCEIELKPSCLETAPLPDDILTNRDTWFAGSYPYLASIVDAKPAALRLTPQRQANYDLREALAHCRHQYGAVLRTALRVYKGDYAAVLDAVMADHESPTLREAGSAFACLDEVL